MSAIKNLFVFAVIVSMLSCTNNNNKSSNKEIIKDEMKEREVSKYVKEDSDLFLFVGTYTPKHGGEGIYLYKFNTETGEAFPISMIEADNPSYLALSNNGKYVYAVGESGDNSSVSAFAFDAETGVMSHINTQSSNGADPCYIEIDSSDRNIVVANYSGGSVATFSIKDDGSLSSANLVTQFSGSGADQSRQASPHLHSVRFSPDNRFLFATDLGTDKLYRFDSTGSAFEGQPVISQSGLIEFDVPSETGPRHFDFHPSGRFMYLLGELSGEILVYDYNDGLLIQRQSVLSDSLGARGAGDIHVSPDGRFVYASNRLKGDGISIFSIDNETGELVKVGYQNTGIHPRNFVITPDGGMLLVACRDDNAIQVYKINRDTGILEYTNNDIVVKMPVCLKLSAG